MRRPAVGRSSQDQPARLSRAIPASDSPENLAILRHLALNLAKLEPSKGSMRGKLKRAGWNDDYLAKLLAGFEGVEVR